MEDKQTSQNNSRSQAAERKWVRKTDKMDIALILGILPSYPI
nr:MAG TPA: hypothetical protein [Caudoviricetes sp.]